MTVKQDYVIWLQSLIGLRIQFVGRAADLLWIHFGDVRDILDHKGKPKAVGEWALHVQTSWRFVRKTEIIVGSSDVYYSSADLTDHSWDGIGESRFDQKINTLRSDLAMTELAVQSITCDGVGGFKMIFDEETSFDVFTHISTDQLVYEFWRFFRPDYDDDHFVCEATPQSK